MLSGGIRCLFIFHILILFEINGPIFTKLGRTFGGTHFNLYLIGPNSIQDGHCCLEIEKLNAALFEARFCYMINCKCTIRSSLTLILCFFVDHTFLQNFTECGNDAYLR